MRSEKIRSAGNGSFAKYAASAVALAAGAGILIFPKAVSAAVGEAIRDCLESVIPSLFSFTALALWLQRSGIYRVALRFLTYPLSKLLRMDEELCAVFVLANIGGFPTGVKLLSELVDSGRLTRQDAGRMLCCCFGSGPSFVIGIVGLRVFDSVGAGLLLFTACFASSLLMAAIVRLRGEIALKNAQKCAENAKKCAENAQKCAAEYDLSAACFIDAVVGSARVMFTVCAMIVGFAALTALLREIGVMGLAARLFPNESVPESILEITRIKRIALSNAALPVCAALLSFGGLCVHLQITALGRGIPMRDFILSRVPAMAMAAAFALPFSRKFASANVPVLAVHDTIEVFTKNGILSLCVLFMCVILLIDIAAARRKK